MIGTGIAMLAVFTIVRILSWRLDVKRYKQSMCCKETIKELLARAKKEPKTDEELARWIVSFAYGNAQLSNPNITRKMVQDAFDAERKKGNSET